MVQWKKLLSKTLVICLSLLTTVLSITVIVYSSLQNFDVHPSGFITDKSFCQDSILNEHRPIRVFFTPKSTNGTGPDQTVHYKLCTVLPSSNDTVYCITESAQVGSVLQLFCGWPLGTTAKRIGIVIGQLLLLSIVLIWMWKDWSVFGFLHVIGGLIVLVGYWYLMIIDADAIRQSNGWCTDNFSNTLCNPKQFSQYPQDCDCNYWNYISVTFMSASGIILWTLTVVVSVLRLYVSFCYDAQEEGSYHDLDKPEMDVEEQEHRIQALKKNQQ